MPKLIFYKLAYIFIVLAKNLSTYPYFQTGGSWGRVCRVEPLGRVYEEPRERIVGLKPTHRRCCHHDADMAVGREGRREGGREGRRAEVA